jgi:pimeloyl-ACP methyl ester carboxylesterase
MCDTLRLNHNSISLFDGFGSPSGKGKIMSAMAFCAMCIGTLACVMNVAAGENYKAVERTLKVDDIDIHCRSYGEGEPLLMIMGYGSTLQLWEEATIQALASRFKVIVFDNRGMGDTSTGQHAFSIEQFADDAAGLILALGLDRVDVLGWSMGSLIAQELYLRHREKVKSLVLYASHCDASMYPSSPEVLQKMTDTSGTPEEQGMRYISVLFPEEWLKSNGQRIREIFYRPMGKINGENVWRQALAIGEWKGSTARLSSIAVPVLILAGTDDQLVPASNARFLSEKIPGAKLALHESAGHGLMFQDPSFFLEQVKTFLM